MDLKWLTDLLANQSNRTLLLGDVLGILVAGLVLLSIGSQPSHGQQVATAERLAYYRTALPRLADREWHAVVHDPRVIWYTEIEIPRAYQHGGGFHWTGYNISADPTDAGLPHGQGGNAGADWPWNLPGGTHAATGAVSQKGLLLPAGKPVIVWRDRLPGHPGMGPEPGLRWRFPVGATLIEVLRHPVAGQLTTFEIRLRRREDTYWNTEVFRPFPRCEDLAAALQATDPTAAAWLRSQPALQVVDFTDRLHVTRTAYRGSSGVAWLPVLQPETAAHLLTSTPFRTATGSAWLTQGAVKCYAPTTEHRDQLVPPRYLGTIAGSDTRSCVQCHDGAQQHARHFDRPRGWYGHVPGSDQILSWHPVSPSAVSRNGAQIAPRLRQSWMDAGVIAWFDARAHAPADYPPLSESPP